MPLWSIADWVYSKNCRVSCSSVMSDDTEGVLSSGMLALYLMNSMEESRVCLQGLDIKWNQNK